MAVCGVHDGGYPRAARRQKPSGPSPEKRDAVAKALGQWIDREGQREDETSLLLGVLATATEAVVASAARYDLGGRSRGVSPFFGDMQRAAGVRAERIDSEAPSRARRGSRRGGWSASSGATPTRRGSRGGAALGEVFASIAARRGGRARAAGVLRDAPDAPGGPYNGRIDHDPALVRALGAGRLGGAHRKPLGVTHAPERAPPAAALNDRSRLEVLGAQGARRRARAIDAEGAGAPLAQGSSECEGQDAATPPPASCEACTDRWAAVRAALDEAGAEFSLKESKVNPNLLEADLRAIRRQVESWLGARLAEEDGWEMLETEVAFGPRKALAGGGVPMPGGRARGAQGAASTASSGSVTP